MDLVVVGLGLAWVLLIPLYLFAIWVLERYGRMMIELEAVKASLDQLGAMPLSFAGRQTAADPSSVEGSAEDLVLAPPTLVGPAEAGSSSRFTAGEPPTRALLERPAPGASAVAPAGESLATPDGESEPGAYLQIGTPAPAFRLPRLEGGEFWLDELRGQCLLLLFGDPSSPALAGLLPELEGFHSRSGSQVGVLLVAWGDPPTIRAQQARYGLTIPIVLDRRRQVSRDYGVEAEPVAYRVDERSVLASEAAIGVGAIRELVLQTAPS